MIQFGWLGILSGGAQRDDHAIVVGEVKSLRTADNDPLLYCRGKMGKLPENLSLVVTTP